MGAKSSKLHVANGSEKTVVVRLSDKVLVTDAAVDLTGELGVKDIKAETDFTIHPTLQWDEKEDSTMFKIASGDYVLAHEETRKCIDLYLLTGDVYCTISTTGNEYVCKHFKVPFNRSIIVTKQLTLLTAKKGKIWIDESGKDHHPHMTINESDQ